MTDREPKPARAAALPLTAAQQKLVVDSRRYVRRATKFYGWKYRKSLSPEDVAQQIELALVEAARHFDPEHGVSFTTFASLRVAGALADAAAADKDDAALRGAVAACLSLQDGRVGFDEPDEAVAARAREKARRGATAIVLGVGLGEAAQDTSAAPAVTPESELLDEELRETIRDAVAALPERSRRVIDAHYREGQTLRAAAAALAVSYATVRNDHDDALDRIRETCAAAGYRPGS